MNGSRTTMSLWARITEALAALAAGEPLSAVFAKLTSPPERTVGFAIAVIALGAKLAKSDGEVTRAEVMAFREVFHVAPSDEAAAARVFNLARQDSAGFESYAKQIARLFDGDCDTLEDILDGLFHVAMADGQYHPLEDMFLGRVAQIFDISERAFRATRARMVPEADRDPYDVLGVDADAPMEDIRTAWRKMVRDTHPDVMMARGLPEEAVKIAQDRMVAVNKAWETINQARDQDGDQARDQARDQDRG